MGVAALRCGRGRTCRTTRGRASAQASRQDAPPPQLVAQPGVLTGGVGVDQHDPGGADENVRDPVGGDQAVVQHYPSGGLQCFQPSGDSGFLPRLATQIASSGFVPEATGHLSVQGQDEAHRRGDTGSGQNLGRVR